MELASKYQLLDQIGSGGMAHVHRARQRGIAGFDRIVALKRIRPELAAQADFIARFVREARIVSTLAHPNIVQLYELGRSDGGHYIAMEYLEGWSLLTIASAAFAANIDIPLHVVLGLLHELCDALDHVHTRRGLDGAPLHIVHRDISLGNLFISRSGHLKLIDFGIATADGLDQHREPYITGKPGYMAPETIRGKAVDARADIFAVGVIAWELLTRRRLFDGRDDDQTMRAVLRDQAAPPSRFRADCPAEADQLIGAALAKKLSDRTPSAAALRDQLEAVMRAYEIEVRPAAVMRWIEDSELFAPHARARTADPEPPTTIDRPIVVSPIAPVHRPAAPSAVAVPTAPLRRRFAGVAAAFASISVVVVTRVALSEPPRDPALPPPVVVTPIEMVVTDPATGDASTEALRGPERTVPADVPTVIVHPPVSERARPEAPRPTARAREERRPREDLRIAPTPPAPAPASRTVPVSPATPMVVAPPVPAPPPAPRTSTPPRTSAPPTIAPDRVRLLSGAIARIDLRRLQIDPSTVRRSFAAVLCIDERGAVASVRFVTNPPPALHDVLARDLGTFRFTPYRDQGSPIAACFVRQVKITLD